MIIWLHLAFKVTNAADFTITLEDEGKVITSLAKELHILTVEIKQKLAEVEKGVEKESGEIRRDIIHGEEEMKKVK